ncbi:MAG: transglutaminase-like domain-containing protein [Phycisphaerales bacterium]|nr:transglutaminase-like domain-containing protein [Phycisphaerales bacterium]
MNCVVTIVSVFVALNVASASSVVLQSSALQTLDEILLKNQGVEERVEEFSASESCEPTRHWLSVWEPSVSFDHLVLAELAVSDTARFNVAGARSVPFSIRIENKGDTLGSFWLSTPGAIDSRTSSSIVASLVNTAMTDREKAMAIWSWVARVKTQQYNAPGVMDPVIAFNGYGKGLCGSDAHNFATLCLEAGLQARVRALGGHVVPEVVIDGDWALLDPNHEFFVERDGRLLSVDEIAESQSLIPKFDPVGWDRINLLRVYQPPNRVVEPVQSSRSMNLELGPGDIATFAHLTPMTPPVSGNSERPIREWIGKGTLLRRYANVREDLSPTRVVLHERWSYPIAGTSILLTMKKDNCRLLAAEISADSVKWEPVEFDADLGSYRIDLSEWFRRGTLVTEFYLSLRFKNAGQVNLREVVSIGDLVTDFYYNQMALPLIHPGGNQIDIDSAADVWATFRWFEFE